MGWHAVVRSTGVVPAQARTTPLFTLLGGFAVVVCGVLVVLLQQSPRGEQARHAYGPADFPTVFGVHHELDGLTTGAVGTAARARVVAPTPPLDKDTSPCKQCHDNKELKTKPEPRKLRDPHDADVLEHRRLWCLDCHDAADRDKLRLASGERVKLTDPMRLCAQCHGVYARDWEAGIHGKRTGYWDGQQRLLPCVECHHPHRPHVKPLVPLPPPVRPAFLTEKKP